jgi:hypothetical protein
LKDALTKTGDDAPKPSQIVHAIAILCTASSQLDKLDVTSLDNLGKARGIGCSPLGEKAN